MSCRVETAHFILTRFNTRAPYIHHYQGLDEAWLQRRAELFEQFTLPSMGHARLCTWLVFFDAGTKAPFRRQIDRYRTTTASVLTPVFVDGVLTDARIAQYVEERIPRGATHLITTRLDNDDALALNYVARVQQEFRPTATELINFPLGYQYSAGRLYWWCDTSNPFISLVEAITGTDRVTTVFCNLSHRELAQRAPVRQVLSRPSWLQVIHGSNLANEVRGVRRLGASRLRHFAVPESLLADEPMRCIASDFARSTHRFLKAGPRRLFRLAIGHRS